jgi:hypothetical protein
MTEIPGGAPQEVMLDFEATEEEVAAVQAAFDGIGLPVRVAANYHRRGVGDFPWLISISAAARLTGLKLFQKPIDTVLDPPMKVIGDRLAAWVNSLFEARKRPEGSVVIEQSDADAPMRTPEILLGRGLPAEAYEQLIDLFDRDAFDELVGECWQIRYINGAWERPW